ncbi:MAG: transcriptional regulator BolA [Candidatus Accumulibacter regalis]|jgi:acid stress-induced BolA-like protein IbaG/YrbA|uniref:Transcriptional regulator BolA n=1 Tax=Accumulibacter regalis TaxID=522306 RepID=A0A011Q7N9_ACCRE|nr:MULTISPECIES: BolA/IbaG family iron-sulfur metabolism protein [unclassified Candidatus Accumulibacter]EXI85262.1 MAG: transcriptional regulator BolA [Candidatus Accumulibacter regalis]MBL8366485.1 BolA/IbaG family iron-sulfur metabolism protein [Accumulibacter sp.]MBN8514048.1 BolA/IbaG family iron-sulfur metabolism protein [Accumulibacter sp.]MBO3702648.1 BolA/IbaG family iron-sulfur metabolism protein [Accumulibacter sp.]HRE71106.1 BolA/IbaG family iron-sulfur metabolism protein [Accumuli
MMHPEQVQAIIAEGIACAHLEVAGDGHHFEALIVSAEFIGKNRVQRQQAVNEVLRQHFDSGQLHALSMKTQTPEEWGATRG